LTENPLRRRAIRPTFHYAGEPLTFAAIPGGELFHDAPAVFLGRGRDAAAGFLGIDGHEVPGRRQVNRLMPIPKTSFDLNVLNGLRRRM
jgi:hypothetical protein